VLTALAKMSLTRFVENVASVLFVVCKEWTETC